MIVPPAAPRARRNKRTIALVVTGVVVAMSLCAGGLVALTVRSGLLDQVLGSVEDSRAFAELREGACIAEMPWAEPGDPLRRNVRPPKVVDCDAEEAEWIIDDARRGVSLELYERYSEDQRTVDLSDLCDTDLARLWYVYAVRESANADTVTVYCFVTIPMALPE